MLARDRPAAVDLLRRVTMGVLNTQPPTTGSQLDCRRPQASERELPPTGTGPYCETITAVSPQLEDSVFLSACRRQPVPYTPVWFMRQAGRSLPEYRAARRRTSMVEACTKPDLVTELTLQPLRRYPVDAAILFSDIVVPLRAAGVGIDIRAGVGPVVEQPIREERDLQRLRLLAPGEIHYVAKAAEAVVAELDGTPLIGFAGGPFTLASYLVDGGPSKSFDQTKSLMYGNPPLWDALLRRLADITITFLQVQIAAGASAVQLFDSWAGAVSPEDYRQSVLPHSKRIFAALADSGVPRLHFGVGTGELLGLMGEAGADVIGVDWRVPLDEAVRRVEPGKALQGNLDPAILLAPWEVIERRALQVLNAGRTAEGHVFNLGHGVLPQTDPDVLARLTELVHTASARLPS
jgi:uroporphyrinogen decarboxylase